jgi:hypothetical protein
MKGGFYYGRKTVRGGSGLLVLLGYGIFYAGAKGEDGERGC